MARWADGRGFTMVVLSEHHDTDDGFMSCPLTIAAAILGSTSHLSCTVSALPVPLHDPAHLAEEIATIDLMAPGRLSVVAGLGYRPSEFEMFGKDRRTRAKDFERSHRPHARRVARSGGGLPGPAGSAGSAHSRSASTLGVPEK